MPVPVFCCCFVSEKLFGEVSQNHLKIYQNYLQAERSQETEDHPEGATQRLGATWPRPRGDPRLGPTWPPPVPPRVNSPPIYSSSSRKPKGVRSYPPEVAEAAAISNPSSEGFCSPSWHPTGEGNQCRRDLHHHACLRSDA